MADQWWHFECRNPSHGLQTVSLPWEPNEASSMSISCPQCHKTMTCTQKGGSDGS